MKIENGVLNMKKLWVLSIRTSLPDACIIKADLQTSFSAFETFEDAKKAMRDAIKGFAFSENTMFNGNGKIVALEKYIANLYEYDDEDDCDDALTKDVLTKIHDAFFSIFNGEEILLDIEKGEYTDYMISFNYDDKGITMWGDYDGPINGYDPYIATNAFSMEEEKDYYLYIDDLLCQDYSSELYIDLKQVEVK